MRNKDRPHPRTHLPTALILIYKTLLKDEGVDCDLLILKYTNCDGKFLIIEGEDFSWRKIKLTLLFWCEGSSKALLLGMYVSDGDLMGDATGQLVDKEVLMGIPLGQVDSPDIGLCLG